MKTKLRKGHWVTQKHWNEAYKIDRIKNGLAFIKYDNGKHEVDYMLKFSYLIRYYPSKDHSKTLSY